MRSHGGVKIDEPEQKVSFFAVDFAPGFGSYGLIILLLLARRNQVNQEVTSIIDKSLIYKIIDIEMSRTSHLVDAWLKFNEHAYI